jgi:hypothetical protein
MSRRLSIQRLSLLFLLAATACADAREADPPLVAEVGIVGVKPGMTRTEYMALPDSARLDVEGDSSSWGTGRGVAVELDVQLRGFAGRSVPLAYTLHDARNKVAFVSQTIPVASDADRWRRRAHVWLPVPSPGAYYVQVAVNDSTGRRTDGPRTPDFTVQ